MAKHVIKDYAEPIKISISQLEGEIAGLEKQLEGVDEIYAQLRQKKKQVTVLNQTMARLSGQPSGQNRPRGKNLVDISDYLEGTACGATVREISEATGINIPSVRYTLSRNEQFVRDNSNIWTLSEEA